MGHYIVEVDARQGHNGIANGGLFGRWSRVWASRPDVVSVRVLESTWQSGAGYPAWRRAHTVVEIETTCEFGERDYLIEECRYTPQPGLGGSGGEESFRLLAGTMPAWADFPSAWQEWVAKVRDEGVDFLIAYAAGERGASAERIEEFRYYGEPPRSPQARPDLLKAILHAERKCAKNRIISAWVDVAGMIGFGEEQVRRIRGTGSWTAVRAMPIRIALRLGWVPSVPKPRYQKMEEGAVLIADPNRIGNKG